MTDRGSPLRIPAYRAIWLANTASNFGGLIQLVGASWMMAATGGTPEMIALVQTSTTLPVMLLSLAAGAIADNVDRRKVMLAAQCFMLLVSTLLAVLAFTQGLSPWLLLAFTFLIGCGTALNGPAWQAAVFDMVPRELLPSAVSLNTIGVNLARSAGPALGGAIVAAAGAGAAFLVNAVSYVGLIGVLFRWRNPQAQPALPPERLPLAMGAGIRYAAMSPAIRVVLLRSALFGLGAIAVQALLPLVARDLVGGGPLTYGVLLGAFGIGAVAGAVASGRLRERYPVDWLARVGALLVATGAALAASSRLLALTLPAMAIAGAGWVLALATFNVSVQLSSPRWVAARAVALYQTATFGSMALGSWLLGLLATHAGVAVALYVATGCLVVSVLAARIWPLAETAGNLDPQAIWQEPQLAVQIERRSGPIVIAIEHRIAEKDILPFLRVMNERRRIRLRDGARGWTLLRDLGDPELWHERYHVPTWLDYLRHNGRRTQADAANSAALHALWLDGHAVVHRMIERQVASLPPRRDVPAPMPTDPPA